MALRRVGLIPLPAGERAGYDHADVYRDRAPGASRASVIDTRRLELLETVPTEAGAHTLGWDPDGRRLYAFLPASEGAAMFADG